ncbi:MAG TPA: D-alanyl-D-alanine carboxypeptidase/D-alanyl-D-alanine-endopeptidase [Vicinamibacteria bacterium]|nr:D-alanyl-D-alanine carboxypeptidase/D-alanyl-D-alanine-endopeptidase [Vicinamibacteria bacterium]
MRTAVRAVVLVALLAAFAAGPPRPARAKAPDRLVASIEAILKREVFAPAIVAIDIRDLETGRVLFEKSAATNVKPASTMKLFTTAAILDAEGQLPATPATTVETAGRLDGLGRILGDVYLVGRGDPNLSDRFEWRSGKSPFDQLAKDIKDAGITRIEGRVIGYDGLFTDETIPDGWTADDLVWSYGAEVSALSAFDNSLDLRVDPGEREGDPGLLTVQPATDFMRIESRVVTSMEGTKAKLSLTRPPGSRHVVIEGSVPRLGEAWTGAVAAPEPTLFAITLFAEALVRHGVTFRDGPLASREPLPKDLRPLASIRGPAVAEQIRVVNKESQNLHAETLLRRLGLAAFKDASVESSLKAREAFLKGQGVRVADTAMYDGSGLSRGDLVTARAEVDLLVAMARHPLAKAFRDSLPIAGVDGTLKKRMIGTKAQGRVFAKTGSLSHVNALAGYVDAISGRRFAFSIVVNHHTRPSKEVTAAMDEICALLVDLR